LLVILILNLPTIFACQAYAATSHALPTNVIIAAGIGYSYFPKNNEPSFAISNYVYDTLRNTQKDNLPSFSASVQASWFLTGNAWLSQIAMGPAIYYQRQNNHGDVFEYNNPEFDNYSYHLHSKDLVILMSADLYTHPICQGLIPFFSAGLGAGFVNTHYDDYAKAGIPVNSELHLDGKQSTQFAAMLGGGVMLPLSTHWSASIRYQYINLGQAHTAQVPAYRLQQGIPVNLNSHNIFLTVSYLL